MKNVLIFGLLLIVIITSGCIGGYSSSEQQDISKEQEEPKTEITTKGFGDLKMTITPSTDKVVKGIVTITLTNAAIGTEAAAFAIYEQGADETIKAGGPNLGFDADNSDGWEYILDTTKYENGVYEVSGVVGEGFDEDKGPSGFVKAQIIIEN